jgi:hypothetical protein
MALTFDGVDDEIRCAVSTPANITFGTYAAILRKNGGDGANTNFLRQTSAALANLGGLFLVTNNLTLNWAGLISASPAIDVTVANNWQLVVGGKATGTSASRFYRYVYDTDTATFGNGSGTSANGTAPGTTGTYRIGSRDAGPYWNGDILIAACWNRLLLDTEMENLRFSLQGWHASGPVGLWLLDQSATSQLVIDMTGSGGNETTRTGTAVATNHPKVWNRHGEVWQVRRTSPGGPAVSRPFYYTTWRRRAA